VTESAAKFQLSPKNTPDSEITGQTEKGLTNECSDHSINERPLDAVSPDDK